MDEPSPARLYASLVGAALVVAGIVGFFYSASFGSPGEVEDAFGIFAVNGWSNVLHVLSGALGLFVAGYASRTYSLWLGAAYVALALWGFALGSGAAILGFLPVNAGIDLFHLVLGGLGVAAALASQAPRKRAAATA
ncbi:MAG: DUF4383 domain-containing protein [Solirubrobacterales bacterium]